jgi:hypothetical protein
MQIERANAEPRLKANVAEAQRPFEVARLLATVKGATEVNSQWSALMGGEVSANAKEMAAITSAASAVLASLPAK